MQRGMSSSSSDDDDERMLTLLEDTAWVDTLLHKSTPRRPSQPVAHPPLAAAAPTRPPIPIPHDSNASRKRRRQELATLQDHVSQLSAQLATSMAHRAKATPSSSSRWHAMAAQMHHDTTDAIATNHIIQHDVRAQLRFGHALQSLLQQQPALPDDVPSLREGHWRDFHLPADPARRRAMATEIATEQYKLLTSVLITSRLYERHLRPWSACVPKIVQANGRDEMAIECVLCRVFDASAAHVTQRLWELLQGDLATSMLGFTLLETLDDHLVYGTVEYPNCLDRLILWRVDERDRHVIVLRSILRDDGLPPPPNVRLVNASAWAVIEPISATRACYKYVLRASRPHERGPLSDPQVKQAIELAHQDWGALVARFDRAMQPSMSTQPSLSQ
ncbi:Aste57867_15892 [Aphanomyces stellatus]|uniref:Aste57867_15892 protein n=1 Tax=Aphanomyces stellatus TaxID=120398 RepID=A0A485L479_9STRA|nr:hypothetical protein As57867_015836 [Aphanomyces stellatus]VFT92679.1 Aste57867_15892 [Aphanomyces stellatus]